MTRAEAAREFQRLLLLNGAFIDPPDPDLLGYEPGCLFDYRDEL